MSDAAAIKATFSDFKLIKGRRCAQLVFEVPIEQADAAVRTLGGMPQPATERWCGIAMLDMTKAAGEAPSAPVKRPFSELPIAQRAALLCDRDAFHKFMANKNIKAWYDAGDRCGKDAKEAAAIRLREICRVHSRAELATNPTAASEFRALEREFDLWLRERV